MAYKAFPVAGAKSGLSKYNKPWLEPSDSLQEAEDIYVFRSSITKRFGYSLYAPFPTRVGLYMLGTGDGSTTVFAGNLPYTTVGKQSIEVTHTNGSTLVIDGIDDGAGAITGTNISAGTINYGTGAISITFGTAPTDGTPIVVEFGQKFATGDGGTTTFDETDLPWSPPNNPLISKSIIVGNTNTSQESVATGDTTTDGVSGTISTNPSGAVTYATSNVSVTFTTPPPAAAADQDVYIKYQFLATATSPIKGIKQWWDSTGDQNTIVFTNRQAAIMDTQYFRLTNISGGNIFNCGDKDFFITTNYQNKLWIVNNADRLATYDGTGFAFPVVSFSGSATVNDLTTALGVFVFKDRLVLIRPVESGVTQYNRVAWSAISNPLDWDRTSLAAGASSFLDAPTNEWIIGAEFLKDELIVQFQDSAWKLVYTGISNDPFRWQKINETKRTDAPYSLVGHQDMITSVGTTGLTACDGITQQRYDDQIVDYVYDEIDQDNIENVNGFRYDQYFQQWLCHPSPDKAATDYSDKWLVWNWKEKSFSTWNIDSTTFGFYFQFQDLAWQDFNAANNMDWSWNDVNITNSTWLSFFSQGKAKIPLFGTKDGKLMKVLPFFADDNGTNFGFSFLTKDFNPFVKDGMQARLGYIDFYFDSADGDGTADPDYELSIDLFLNESSIPYKTVILNPSLDDFKQKRVYINAIGNFHRFKVYLSDDQIANSTVATKGFKLNGWIWWAEPAGRLV